MKSTNAKGAHSEAWVKKEVKKILVKHGIFFYMPSAALYGAAGASDFLCCASKGRFLAIEAKAGPKDNPTELQKMFLDNVAIRGGYTFVVHRDNLEELNDYLTDHFHFLAGIIQ